jgi:predicted metalloendopeptidase
MLADYLIDSIDESVEPCEDFYQFVCGTWLKNTRIPDDGKCDSLFFANTIILNYL